MVVIYLNNYLSRVLIWFIIFLLKRIWELKIFIEVFKVVEDIIILGVIKICLYDLNGNGVLR